MIRQISRNRERIPSLGAFLRGSRFGYYESRKLGRYVRMSAHPENEELVMVEVCTAEAVYAITGNKNQGRKNQIHFDWRNYNESGRNEERAIDAITGLAEETFTAPYMTYTVNRKGEILGKQVGGKK